MPFKRSSNPWRNRRQFPAVPGRCRSRSRAGAGRPQRLRWRHCPWPPVQTDSRPARPRQRQKSAGRSPAPPRYWPTPALWCRGNARQAALRQSRPQRRPTGGCVGRGRADGIAQRDGMTTHIQQRPRHLRHLGGRRRPVIAAVGHAGHIAAHRDARAFRRRQHRGKPRQAFGDAAIEVGPAEAFRSRAKDRDRRRARRQRRLKTCANWGSGRQRSPRARG